MQEIIAQESHLSYYCINYVFRYLLIIYHARIQYGPRGAEPNVVGIRHFLTLTTFGSAPELSTSEVGMIFLTVALNPMTVLWRKHEFRSDPALIRYPPPPPPTLGECQVLEVAPPWLANSKRVPKNAANSGTPKQKCSTKKHFTAYRVCAGISTTYVH